MSFVRCSRPRRSLGLEPASKSFEHRLFLSKTAFDETAFVLAEFGVQLFPVALDVLPERRHQSRFLPDSLCSGSPSVPCVIAAVSLVTTDSAMFLCLSESFRAANDPDSDTPSNRSK